MVKSYTPFRPINKWPKNKKVFDIISFVIFCPKHNTIALTTQTENGFAVGFPFIYLSSYIKIDSIIEDNLCLILSGGDFELMAKYKEVLPFDTNVSHVLSLRLRQFKFGFTRFMCFVRIHRNNPVLKCCQYDSRLVCYRRNEIFHISDKFWDDTKFIFKIVEYMKSIRNEYEIVQDIFPHNMSFSAIYYSKSKQRKLKLDVLKFFNINEKDINLFFIEFIDHCFPSVYMTFNSFKHFLKDLGLELSVRLMKRIFYNNNRDLW